MTKLVTMNGKLNNGISHSDLMVDVMVEIEETSSDSTTARLEEYLKKQKNSCKDKE